MPQSPLPPLFLPIEFFISAFGGELVGDLCLSAEVDFRWEGGWEVRRMRSRRISGTSIREMGGREHGRDLPFQRVESVMYTTTHEPNMNWK